MSIWLSRPFQSLRLAGADLSYHTVIVGSGYGAALAALALAMRKDKPYSNQEILVIERGRERLVGDFPKTISDLLGHVSFQGNGTHRTGKADAILDVRGGDNANVIVGSGLGGTSLINAGVAVDPDAEALASLPRPHADSSEWLQLLAPSLKLVRQLLWVGKHPKGDSLEKVIALRKLAKSLDCVVGNPELVDIAVSFAEGPNNVGVQQAKCTDCGNCFTGCNIGAKSTLAMNAWPLLEWLRVNIVTGGTVDYVERSDDDAVTPWRVLAHDTTDVSGTNDCKARSAVTIKAKRVILAAGSLGSTEILARSKMRGKLACSDHIGDGFSLNGDGIAFGFGQRDMVRGCATVPSADDVTPGPDQRPGPTIVAKITISKNGRRGLIEDATIPQPIVSAWAELLSTQAQLRRYGARGESAWHKANSSVDPLTVPSGLLAHHQTLLLMATEKGATGTLRFDAEHDQIDIHWPPRHEDPASDQSTMTWFDERLNQAHSKKGFDGGLFLASPLWRPLPENFESVFEGAGKLGGVNLSNHPLGGCAMAEHAGAGVVNALGQVFRSNSGRAAYDDLYVLDGAILPAALGINPYMTIAGLAHYLALQMDGGIHAEAYMLPSPPPRTVPSNSGSLAQWPPPTLTFELREQLFGSRDDAETRKLAKLLGVPAPIDEKVTNLFVLDVTITIPDLNRFLANPSEELPARFRLFVNKGWRQTIDTIRDEFLGELLGEDKDGRVQLFAPDKGWFWKIWRGGLAVRRFIQLRGDEIASGKIGGGGGIFEKILGFIRVAREHAHWRYLNYKAEFQVAGKKFKITGSKRLAYDGSRDREVRDESNPWTTLMNLELEFRSSGQSASAFFHVDLQRLSKGLAALQSTGRAETPQIVSAMTSFGGLVLRSLLQTHLWSFGAPSYDKFPTRKELKEKYGIYDAPREIMFDTEKFAVEVLKPPGEKVADFWRLMLARARTDATRGPPVLLIHGVAHSSSVFHTRTLKRNLAGYLLKKGYDVYFIDHGLSTSIENPNNLRPSVEDISAQITEAIRFIHQKHAKPLGIGVRVFSHCIGSAALSMSILGDGMKLFDEGVPMIQALVMHAVPPWICASEANIVRAYIGVYFRSRFFPASIDPIPTSANELGGPSVIETVLDRIGGSIPWTRAEHRGHDHKDGFGKLGRTICNRMTLFYGYDWSHHNLGSATHDDLVRTMGPVNSDAYRQLYFLIARGRVTDKFGANSFVQLDRLRRFWTFPTLFLHGRENETFNFDSSVLSSFLLNKIAEMRGRRTGRRQEIDIRVLDKYGHLDTLIGENAHADVFPTIETFLEASNLPPQTIAPRMPAEALTYPVTGPVISHPRFVDGKHTIRAWVETNEFQASRTKEVQFVQLNASFDELEVAWLRKLNGEPSQREGGYLNRLQNTIFWLGDVPCDDLHKRFAVRVENEDGGIPLPFRVDPAKEVAASAYVDPEFAIMQWPGLPWFDRFISGRYTGLSFVVGSCWYPGSWFDQGVADEVFINIRKHVERQDGIDHLLLVGDQIYADASYSIFDIKEDRERFQESYRHAFRSSRARWVLRHVPTYFAIDDHEFRDGFPERRLGEKQEQLLELGRAARLEAWNFLMHHNHAPAEEDDKQENWLWHSFSSAGHEFFVFDTRSERDPAKPGLQRLIGKVQEEGFRKWALGLTDLTRPVFIVTGSPLAPMPAEEIAHPAATQDGDCLRSYPEFVSLLVQTLEPLGLARRVVILSGDPHYSAMCEVRLEDTDKSLDAVCIISSGINIPMPFANDNPRRVDWNTGKERFSFPGNPAISVEIGRRWRLSEAMRHVLRLDVSYGEGGKCSLSVGVIEAGRVDVDRRDPIEL